MGLEFQEVGEQVLRYVS